MRRTTGLTLLLTSLAALLAGCGESTLSSSWQIDRLRILAVRAEPAEPAPGDLVTFESLTVHPDNDDLVTVWFACLLEASSSYGCEGIGDTADTADTGADVPEGLIGYEPDWPPTYVPDESALEGLTEEERIEGRNILLTLVAFENAEEWDFEDENAELATKRVPVSENPDPNQNPTISGLQVNGVDLPEGGLLEVDAKQTYTFTPMLSDDTIQTYSYTNSDGATEQRVEEPYFTFAAEGGSLQSSSALYPYSDFDWTAPSTANGEEIRIWIVVRDRRGGMGWWTQRIKLQ
jgi:hypothetical protein